MIALNSFTKGNLKDNYIQSTAILQNTPAEN
jgi:hypothetical protein